MTLVGIIGGGQLGRMIALAAYPLGLRFRFLDPGAGCPASQLAPCVVGEYDDPASLEKFAEGLDLVTYEFENVPVATLDMLQGRAPIFPPRAALAVSQDRLSEKRFFQRLGISTPEFAAVNSKYELDDAIRRIGLPAVLKTRRFGYDGKGQEVLREPSDIYGAWGRLQEHACILEQMISFNEEISIIAARGAAGECVFYPLAHNTHKSGILRVSWANPAESQADPLQAKAKDAVRRIMDELGYVGVLALELFVKDGEIVANEIAPRVHNSAHWTIEGAPCSQFENHLRAIAGLPLGATHGPLASGMVNLIGALPNVAPLLAMEDVHLHLYDKEPRAGRKIGHVTAVANGIDALKMRLDEIQTRLKTA